MFAVDQSMAAGQRAQHCDLEFEVRVSLLSEGGTSSGLLTFTTWEVAMTRRILVLITLVMMAIPLFAVAGTSQAWACSCAGEQFSVQTRAADVIFVGRVVKRKDQPQHPDVRSSDDPVIWTFLVDHVDKGSARPQQDVVSAIAEISCGYEFELGRSYVVLAWRQPDAGPGRLVTDLCSGTRPVEPVEPVESTPTTGSLVSGRQSERDASEEGAASGGHLPAVGLALAVGGVVTALVVGVSVFRHRRRLF